MKKLNWKTFSVVEPDRISFISIIEYCLKNVWTCSNCFLLHHIYYSFHLMKETYFTSVYCYMFMLIINRSIFVCFKGEPFCIQTTLSNEFGAGMKCCYRDDHSLIEGYQTLWRSSFVQRHQFIYGTYIDEVKRQDWIGE